MFSTSLTLILENLITIISIWPVIMFDNYLKNSISSLSLSDSIFFKHCINFSDILSCVSSETTNKIEYLFHVVLQKISSKCNRIPWFLFTIKSEPFVRQTIFQERWYWFFYVFDLDCSCFFKNINFVLIYIFMFLLKYFFPIKYRFYLRYPGFFYSIFKTIKWRWLYVFSIKFVFFATCTLQWPARKYFILY